MVGDIDEERSWVVPRRICPCKEASNAAANSPDAVWATADSLTPAPPCKNARRISNILLTNSRTWARVPGWRFGGLFYIDGELGWLWISSNPLDEARNHIRCVSSSSFLSHISLYVPIYFTDFASSYLYHITLLSEYSTLRINTFLQQ